METQNNVAVRDNSVKGLLARADYKKRFEEVMGKRAPQFMASVALAAQQKHLAECKPGTVVAAAFIAATLDLPIDRNLGFAHIVPYKEEAQFQMGYKGFIQLGLRTGQYRTINDCIIPEGVFVSYDELSGELVLDWSKKKSDTAVGYACFFELTNGFRKTVYWPREKVMRHARQYSKTFGKDFSTWSKNFDAMALKTVIKAALSKYGILSVEMQRAITHDQGTQIDIDAEVKYPDNDSEAGKPKFNGPEMFPAGSGDQPIDVEVSAAPPPADKSPQPSTLMPALAFIEKAGVKEGTAMQFMREAGWIDDSLGSFNEVAEMQPTALEKLVKAGAKAVTAMKAMEGKR